MTQVIDITNNLVNKILHDPHKKRRQPATIHVIRNKFFYLTLHNWMKLNGYTSATDITGVTYTIAEIVAVLKRKYNFTLPKTK